MCNGMERELGDWITSRAGEIVKRERLAEFDQANAEARLDELRWVMKWLRDRVGRTLAERQESMR